MSYAARVEQQRAEHSRAIDLADELRGQVASQLRTHHGIVEGSAIFYGRAFERACTLAGQRIAALEAELTRSDPTSRSAAAPDQGADLPPDGPRAERGSIDAPRLVGSDRAAASHHERGRI